jgi:hypothetical protein
MAYNLLGGDRDQPFLLPPALRGWLPEGHLAWLVLAVVDQLDELFGVLPAGGVGDQADPAQRLVRPDAAMDLEAKVAHELVELQVQGALGGRHQATWWQTGQWVRAARRSQRAWLWALASSNPQAGQEATQRPASRCSAGGRSWSTEAR